MFDDARRLVHAVHVDPREELQQWRLVRVHVPAVDLQRVHPVLVGRLRRQENSIQKVKFCLLCFCFFTNSSLSPLTHPGRPDDHSGPVRKRHVVVILQAPGDCTVADTLLALFQLLQETEISRHHCNGTEVGKSIRSSSVERSGRRCCNWIELQAEWVNGSSDRDGKEEPQI